MRTYLTLLLGTAVLAATAQTYGGTSHVFVSNRGDNPPTMSVVKCTTSNGKQRIKCEERERVEVGFGTSWPANQYRGRPPWWWTGLGGQIVGLKAKTRATPLLKAKNTVFVKTYDLPGVPAGRNPVGSNFIGISPGGRTAWNSAREIDEIQEIDTDPGSPTFGTILTRIEVPLSDFADPEGGRNGRMRPCDATITPDGRFFVEPDLAGETVTIVDIHAKAVAAQLVLPREDPSEEVRPFMATTNGEIALIENLEAPFNTYSVVDISDPFNPVHVEKITQADGLGKNAQTSEFTPDGRFAYLILNGIDNPSGPDDLGRIDVLDLNTLQIVKQIELPVNCRPHTGDFSNDGSHFFLNCSGAARIAVIDNESQEVVAEVPVGTNPRGVIVR